MGLKSRLSDWLKMRMRYWLDVPTDAHITLLSMAAHEKVYHSERLVREIRLRRGYESQGGDRLKTGQ